MDLNHACESGAGGTNRAVAPMDLRNGSSLKPVEKQIPLMLRQGDFDKIDHVPVVLASTDVGHSGAFREPTGGIVAHGAINWLAWQLRGDNKAAKRFTGTPCGLCQEPSWTLRRKKID